VLRSGTLLNIVLIVPDDMPLPFTTATNTLPADIHAMRAAFSGWDPRLTKLLGLCTSSTKWRLTIRPPLNPSWSHPSGAFTILGDAAHAALPYLASGAGMGLEDGHVLGLCLSRISSKDNAEKRKALDVYERCRRLRTEKVVESGNVQQMLYHLRDGPEQRERDRKLHAFGELNGHGRVEEKEYEKKGLTVGDDPLAWRWGGLGRWLLVYDCEEEVERVWREVDEESEMR
jgi:salicylate hydroxylase